MTKFITEREERITRVSMVKKNYMSQMELLNTNWSMSMINKLLPEPELAPNPLWPGHSPMKLWSIEVVKETMQTEDYYILYESYKKRSNACKEAAKRKAISLDREMIELAESASVTIVPDYILIEEAMKYIERQFRKSGRSFDCNKVTNAKLRRCIVNHIRHRLVMVDGVRYDEALDNLAGKVGRDNAYRVTKSILLDTIAIAYPQYRYECERQKWYFENEARKAA